MAAVGRDLFSRGSIKNVSKRPQTVAGTPTLRQQDPFDVYSRLKRSERVPPERGAPRRTFDTRKLDKERTYPLEGAYPVWTPGSPTRGARAPRRHPPGPPWDGRPQPPTAPLLLDAPSLDPAITRDERGVGGRFDPL
eukprot:92335-Prorocentrum_minimum.AAC.1